MAACEHLACSRDCPVDALDEHDGATVPVRNVLASPKLYGLTVDHCGKGSPGRGTCGGTGRERVSNARRRRHFDSGDPNLTPVLHHEAATIHNFRDLAAAEYLEAAGPIRARDANRGDE